MSDYRTVTACRLCDSSKLSTALDLGETPLANELDGTELFPLIVNRCDDCGHHQLSIAVAPGRLWGPNYPYQSGTSPVFRKHLEALADEVAALKPGGRVLEIASNDGTLLRMLRDRGMYWSCGVDPSGPELEEPKLTTWRDSWPSDPSSVPFDCIIALNVFAHVEDLHSFTAAVKEALAPDGVFIVEVGYLPEQIARGQFDTVYLEHLSYHTVRPLASFFEWHGLRIEKVDHIESQGGSIRVYVRHADTGAAFDASAEEETDIGELRPVIDACSVVLHQAMSKLTKRGETVAIYGAPAKLTTLLYVTSLHSWPFACVGDDNPLKVGRTTPGNHIPIVSVEEMLARKPDTVLIAAWNFFDSLRDRLRAAGFNGGIINPMGGE